MNLLQRTARPSQKPLIHRDLQDPESIENLAGSTYYEKVRAKLQANRGVVDTSVAPQEPTLDDTLKDEYFFHSEHFKARTRRKILEQREREEQMMETVVVKDERGQAKSIKRKRPLNIDVKTLIQERLPKLSKIPTR